MSIVLCLTNTEKSKQDRNACTVNALQITTGAEFEICRQIAEAAGRPRHKGWYPKLIFAQAKKYGIRARKINSKVLTLHKFVEKFSTGNYYVCTKRHAFAVVDGVVKDWRETKPQSRITEIYQISGSYNNAPIHMPKPRQKYTSCFKATCWKLYKQGIKPVDCFKQACKEYGYTPTGCMTKYASSYMVSDIKDYVKRMIRKHDKLVLRILRDIDLSDVKVP